jgi:hypothetical protein
MPNEIDVRLSANNQPRREPGRGAGGAGRQAQHTPSVSHVQLGLAVLIGAPARTS